jgi:tetratricopeptide (TPR) repeat protein
MNHNITVEFFYKNYKKSLYILHYCAILCLQKIFRGLILVTFGGWGMITWRTVLILAWSVVALALGTKASLAVTPYDDVLVQQATKNLQQENYDEALAQLTEAWQKGAHTPEKAYLFGQAYRLMLNYAKAKEYLQEALRLKPDFRPAQLMLADTLLAMDQPKEARPILQTLGTSGYEPGQTAYLMGVTATKEGQYSEALDYFRKAETDPKMAQEAKFQASLALAALNKVGEAKKAMEESIALNPQSQTADFAKRYMGVLSQRVEELRPFHISVSTGFEYDSNVTLAPGGGATVSTVSGKGSAVFSQNALLEYTILPNGPFSVLTQYSYFQNFHPAVTGYDIMNHFVGVTPTYGFKNGRFWFPVNYTYMDLQSDKYYTGFMATPTYLHLITEKIGLEVGGKYNRQYYWTPVFLTQDDRTGNAWGGNIGMYYFFAKQKGFVQARFGYLYNNTVGSNWDSASYNLLLSALFPITDKLKYNIFLDLTQQPFSKTFYNGATVGNILGAPLVPQPNRRDQILMFGMVGTYELFKGLEANIHWYFIRDNSNVNLYNYSRHIAGGQLTYRY